MKGVPGFWFLVRGLAAKRRRELAAGISPQKASARRGRFREAPVESPRPGRTVRLLLVPYLGFGIRDIEISGKPDGPAREEG